MNLFLWYSQITSIVRLTISIFSSQESVTSKLDQLVRSVQIGDWQHHDSDCHLEEVELVLRNNRILSNSLILLFNSSGIT